MEILTIWALFFAFLFLPFALLGALCDFIDSKMGG
jgi:hypothetical protein